ncbi:endolytic transglycosylase MltG [candidate division KSB1 bacterium]|nr:endolytic transglycosylase MltG [candidate division KSB1 bacterium]
MKKILKIFLMLIFLAVMITGYFIYSKIFLPPKGDFTKEPIEVKIKPGFSLRIIADTLESKGLIKNKEDFILANKLFRNVNRLKAGRYNIKKGLSVYDVMNIIVEGKTSNIKVVIQEGLISTQIASILAKKVEIDSTKFIKLLSDTSIINQFKLRSNSLEGYLFPNTYFFHWGITEKEIIKILLKEFNRNFSDSLKAIATDKGWKVGQILTLASIIEGEALIDSERAVISSVYHNRLQKGMLLQADPTIQYIIPDGPRRLLNKDLAIDSPYNTYIYPGLPPGPVNNPGKISIVAAISPVKTDYLYFVAKGDGSHIFSKTLSQHLRAKKDFDAYRRKIKRQQRLNNR